MKKCLLISEAQLILLEKKVNWENVPMPDIFKKKYSKEVREKLKEVSLGLDKNGFFVYTHRARSKSTKLMNISVKDIKFIASTG